jgi:hypothetical protein
MIGLQVAVHPSGALDIGLGARSSGSSLGSKGVMPWDESGSLFVRGHNPHLALHACLGADGDLRSLWVEAA